jgi:hypothetical protein
MNEMLVNTLPISTTNMTGFFIMSLGFSFFSDSKIAGRMRAGFQIDEVAIVLFFFRYYRVFQWY